MHFRGGIAALGPGELGAGLECGLDELLALLGKPSLSLDRFQHERMDGLPGIRDEVADPLLQLRGQFERCRRHEVVPKYYLLEILATEIVPREAGYALAQDLSSGPD
jgi:hypothetical protein